jgi:hypothetical protein
MLGHLPLHHLLKRSTAAGMLLVGALAFNGASPLAAGEDYARPIPARLMTAPKLDATTEARQAAATFVWGLSNGHARVVWHFATEEEQDAFGTEEQTYQAFVSAYPPLAYATEMTMEGVTYDGEMPVVALYVTDRLGLRWKASFGLWKDDASDWKVISCDIEPAPGELA